jgi:hypothetical protein
MSPMKKDQRTSRREPSLDKAVAVGLGAQRWIKMQVRGEKGQVQVLGMPVEGVLK